MRFSIWKIQLITAVLLINGSAVGGDPNKQSTVVLKASDVPVEVAEIRTWTADALKEMGLSKEDLQTVAPYLDKNVAEEMGLEKKEPVPGVEAKTSPSDPAAETPKEGPGQLSNNQPSIVVGGPGGPGGMGGGGNPYQASEEPIERHGAIIAPERGLSSSAELPGRTTTTRFVSTDKQVADVKEALGLLKSQPVTSEEQKNLNQVVEKFNRGEVDAKTVSDEIAKIATRLQGLQLQLTSAPSVVPQEKPDLSINFGSTPPAVNPFSPTIITGDAKAEVDVKQSNEIDVKAKLEKEAAKDRAGLSDGEGSWLADLLNPGMFFQNVKDAVGWAFGRDFDPSVSKTLRGLASKNKSAGGISGKLGEANGQYGERKGPPAIKHVLTLSFLLLPLGAGLFLFLMWKRKKGKAKAIQTTRFNVQGGPQGARSKTVFTERDGTMAHRAPKHSKKKSVAPTGTSF